MKNRLTLIFFMLGLSISALAFPPDNGRNIFTTRCAACHLVNRALTGPALAGIDQRRSMEWIINFVHSSQTVIKGGDDYASVLFEKFNRVQMPDHLDLSETEIQSVVAYINAETKAANTTDAPFTKPGKLKPGFIPLTLQKDYWIFGIYLGVVAMLIACLLFAVQFNRIKNNQAANHSATID